MRAEQRTFGGLGILVAAAVIVIGGYAFIWEAEYFWENPLLESTSSFQEASAIFDAYVKEKATLDKQFAKERRRNAQDTRKAKTSKDSAELYRIWAERSFLLAHQPGAEKQPLEELRQHALTVLDSELSVLPMNYEALNKGLVETYQGILNNKAVAEQRAHRNQQGWVVSIVGSVFVLLLAGAVAFMGLRWLRRAGMPGTVFEEATKK
jgi:hypothetical protein